METDTNILAIKDFLTYFNQYMRTYRRADLLAVDRIKREMEEPLDRTTQARAPPKHRQNIKHHQNVDKT
jgi:hypothetical protein